MADALNAPGHARVIGWRYLPTEGRHVRKPVEPWNNNRFCGFQGVEILQNG
jgi:hypothetical protein